MAYRASVTVDTSQLQALYDHLRTVAESRSARSASRKATLFRAAIILTDDTREAILTSYVGEGNRTGGLARSFRPVVRSDSKRTTIATESDLIYAAIQDQGGIIRPKHVKALAIPMKRLPIGKWPRHFKRGELFSYTPKGSKERFLARQKGKHSVEVLYLLRKSVRLEGKDYTGKAVATALPKIVKLFARELTERLR